MPLPLCHFCQTPLAPERVDDGGGVACGHCERPTQLVVFAAILGGSAGTPAHQVDAHLQGASCFYSPEKLATGECRNCGAWISEEWTARWGAEVYCLKCLEHLRQRGADASFAEGIVLWDSVALFLALVPYSLVLTFVGFFTAPAALFLTVRHWGSPRSMVHVWRWRFVVAVVMSVLMLGILGAIIVGAITAKGRR